MSPGRPGRRDGVSLPEGCPAGREMGSSSAEVDFLHPSPSGEAVAEQPDPEEIRSCPGESGRAVRRGYAAVTTAQLARLCGVSQGTVDRALNNRRGISPQTKERVLQAARSYGYIPNIHARVLSGGRSMLLGVVVFDLDNEYFSRLVMELEALCRGEGYSSVVMFSHKSAQQEIDCLNQLVHMGVDGIVLCPVGWGIPFARYLQGLRTPVVTVDNRLEGLPFVGLDNRSAMAQAACHIRERGYDRAVYFAPVLRRMASNSQSENFYAQRERYEGFLSAAEGIGLPVASAVSPEELTALLEIGGRAAVVCPSDYYALQVLSLVQRCPGSGILGFDNIGILDRCALPLSSIGGDSGLLARLAYTAAIHPRDSSQPLCRELPCRIFHRGSL